MADAARDGGSFDVSAYLHTRAIYQLGKLHELFEESFPEHDVLNVLDYGSGPVIQHSISAASKASKIVFCDFFPCNIEAIQKWLNKDIDAFNWSPHFDYVVKTLEGKGEKEARERERECDRLQRLFIVIFKQNHP